MRRLDDAGMVDEYKRVVLFRACMSSLIELVVYVDQGDKTLTP